MTIQEFNSSLTSPNPPAGVSVLLQALWLDAKGDWDAAHHLIDHLEEAKAYWVHAYLHQMPVTGIEGLPEKCRTILCKKSGMRLWLPYYR